MVDLRRAPGLSIFLPSPQALKPSSPQALKPSSPQALKPSSPQALQPRIHHLSGKHAFDVVNHGTFLGFQLVHIQGEELVVGHG